MTYTKYRKNCKWCQAVKADKKLLKRIYASRKYTGKGESLSQIAASVGLPYHSLPNHCKFHQALTDDDVATAEIEKIGRKTAIQLIETNVPTNNVRQSIANEITNTLTSEDFAALDPEAKIKWLLKATKDMDDVKAKQKDQDIDIMKMMLPARSGSLPQRPLQDGEVREVADYNPWEEPDA